MGKIGSLVSSSPFEIVTYVLVAMVFASAVYTYFTTVDPRHRQAALIGIGLIAVGSLYVVLHKISN